MNVTDAIPGCADHRNGPPPGGLTVPNATANSGCCTVVRTHGGREIVGFCRQCEMHPVGGTVVMAVNGFQYLGRVPINRTGIVLEGNLAGGLLVALA